MIRQTCLRILMAVLLCLGLVPALNAQQTLGGITGLVTDPQGSLVTGASVTVKGDQTGLTRTQKSGSNGYYDFPNLPIGPYTITVSHDGFQSTVFPGISVQADRTATVNATLTVGAVSTSVTVEAVPLMNAVDTTNGYTLDKQQLESIPMPNGSPLQTAVLTPGVNAELSSGTGAAAGLGNPPIWANGQRDTSNSFVLNGVDASNLFNGKSTSNVGSARVVNSTGVSTSNASTGTIQSTASIYLSIGNAIPTPAPETVEEVHVNASMYDASQGSTSGAHIEMSTSTGTNTIHGSVYGHRGTDWINAAPFFFKQDGDVPANMKVPQLHRYIAGGSIGGPIIKDKLFAYLAYQHLHVSDQEIGDSFLDVPVGLSDTNRDANGLAGVTNNEFCSPADIAAAIKNGETPCTPFTASQMDHVALALLNSPAVPGEPGKWLIPNDALGGSGPTAAHIDNAFIPGTGRFKADQAVADVDYNATSKDTLSLKYYYQHDPTRAPFAFSSVPGFTEQLDSGAQVFSLGNSYLIKSNLSTTETLGFLREKIYANNQQPFGPSSIPGGSAGTASINMFGSNYFPGVSVYNVLGEKQPEGTSTAILNIGPNAEGQSSNTGVFQNRISPSANAIWTLGKHTIGFGATYSYTQLNTIDKRTGTGTIATDDFSQFAQGAVTPGSSSTGFYVSSFLQGNASRYYRANQLGMYLQDKFQITPRLSLTAGVRYDWDGGLTEKNGRIFNFEPTLYSYSIASDTINNPGFVIAGNNANGTSGVSNTTLTGRQWGIGPRLGAAWQPALFNDKVVVRTGFGMYYDRGELFSYFSPGYAIGTVTGGPFGVNQQLPFVNASTCPIADTYLYEGYIITCGGSGGSTAAEAASASMGNLANPYGTSLLKAPTNPKSSDLSNYLPNAAGILDYGQPISLGVYDRKNKLPYTYNYTLDIQWQPRSDLAIELGYVGNIGRHQVIPVPFNQPNLATAAKPALAGGKYQQIYSYGYTVSQPNYGPAIQLPQNQGQYLSTYEGGNVDLRVPYIGYAAESIDYKAAGVDAYNALTAHVEKRMSHGVQVGLSYTYSHALDEQSGIGLFYNGNNPLNLRDGYASADFDRKHVVNFNYVFKLPNMVKEHSLAGDLIDGWQLVGLTTLQSGQPYSVIDYTGAIGSVYYSTANGITNPIVPLAPGCTAKSATTGLSGAFGDQALKASCFTVPVIAAGDATYGTPSNDPFETKFTTGQRNIFRQAFQKRADMSLVKTAAITERYTLKYTFDVYNVTNTTSFDVPGNEVSQNQDYNAFPTTGQPVTPGTCAANGVGTVPGSFYNCPGGLGTVYHTIGSPRQIQMSLGLTF
jgi:hypothetical protein